MLRIIIGCIAVPIVAVSASVSLDFADENEEDDQFFSKVAPAEMTPDKFADMIEHFEAKGELKQYVKDGRWTDWFHDQAIARARRIRRRRQLEATEEQKPRELAAHLSSMSKQKGKDAAEKEAAELRRLHHVDCTLNLRADGTASDTEYRCDYTMMYKLRRKNEIGPGAKDSDLYKQQALPDGCWSSPMEFVPDCVADGSCEKKFEGDTSTDTGATTVAGLTAEQNEQVLKAQNAQIALNKMWETFHLVGINATWPMHGMHHCWLMCMNQKFFAMWVNPGNTSMHMCG